MASNDELKRKKNDGWMTNRFRGLKIETRMRSCTTGLSAGNKQTETRNNKKTARAAAGFLLRWLESSSARGKNHHRPTACTASLLSSSVLSRITHSGVDRVILLHCGEKTTNVISKVPFG